MQHFHCIVTHYAQVLYAFFFSRSQTSANARECTNAEEILFRFAFAIATSEAPIPKPILR